MAIDTYYKSLSNDARITFVEKVLERCCEAWGVKKIQEIKDDNGNKMFAIGDSTISQWYSRPTFPWDFVVTTALKTGVDLDFLVFGNAKVSSEGDLNQVIIGVSNALYESCDFDLMEKEHIPYIMKKIERELGVTPSNKMKTGS
ncbi:Bacteriophage CI repressor helix-turn-helix domain protein [Pseudoalteromonas sp. P1-9]|uniref:helix-turn-helix domain-containing protein n=1 Tax=Pseudoalteromonas sp. P1-9 TaxID=1710354 RepID=UPI0006D61643|nr:helix-turn-helix domain-containing protein [Pseudoalteromonas sp. P1-9]KPV93941.1 Bacteriophage CI repressor helix-turn-helix domain protein [Pseudoalteromonas sp. P1-9]